MVFKHLYSVSVMRTKNDKEGGDEIDRDELIGLFWISYQPPGNHINLQEIISTSQKGLVCQNLHHIIYKTSKLRVYIHIQWWREWVGRRWSREGWADRNDRQPAHVFIVNTQAYSDNTRISKRQEIPNIAFLWMGGWGLLSPCHG